LLDWLLLLLRRGKPDTERAAFAVVESGSAFYNSAQMSMMNAVLWERKSLNNTF
jgi:hypothetical protein